jgi:hypothetical protein
MKRVNQNLKSPRPAIFTFYPFTINAVR